MAKPSAHENLPICCIVVPPFLLALHVRLEERIYPFPLICKGALSAVAETVVGGLIEIPFFFIKREFRSLDDT